MPASTRAAATASQATASPSGTFLGAENDVPGLTGLLLRLPVANSLRCTVVPARLPCFLFAPPREHLPVDASQFVPEEGELMYVAIAGLVFPGVGSNGSHP